MRSLIVVALLAFLAVGLVAARPAEEEETAVEEVASPEAEETQDANPTGEEAEEETDEEADEDANEDTEEEESDDEDSEDDAKEEETAAPPKKLVRPLWPNFGGHGPAVIHRRAVLLRKA